MRTLKDGRVKVHVFHGYNEKKGHYYGSHTVIYRKPRYQHDVLGFIYNKEWFPYKGTTSDGAAVIIFDVYGRSTETRRKSEQARRAALDPESRLREDHEARRNVVQMLYHTSEEDCKARVLDLYKRRNAEPYKNHTRECLRSAIFLLRGKRLVQKDSVAELEKWGITAESILESR